MSGWSDKDTDTRFAIFRDTARFFSWQMEWEAVTGNILVKFGEDEETKQRGIEKIAKAAEHEKQLLDFLKKEKR